MIFVRRTNKRGINDFATCEERHVEEARVVLVSERIAHDAAHLYAAVVFRTGEEALGCCLADGRRDAVRDERATVAPELGIIVDDSF